MSISMLNKAIAASLEAAFGVNIYTDRSSGHDMEAPCFIIEPGGTEEKRLPMGRLLRTYKLTVRYRQAPKTAVIDVYPGTEQSPDDVFSPLREMGDRLFSLLEILETEDGPLRGSGLHWEIKDCALLFYAAYTLILREEEEREAMEKLEVTVEL